jgi:hypothetical protein
MIELIAVHEPTPEKLAMWLRQNKITYQQFSAAMAGVKNPELAIPPPTEKAVPISPLSRMAQKIVWIIRRTLLF